MGALAPESAGFPSEVGFERVLRGESGSANTGWPYWKEVGNAPPYGMNILPDTFTRKG
jgi:hypothetical protein